MQNYGRALVFRQSNLKKCLISVILAFACNTPLYASAPSDSLRSLGSMQVLDEFNQKIQAQLKERDENQKKQLEKILVEVQTQFQVPVAQLQKQILQLKEQMQKMSGEHQQQSKDLQTILDQYSKKVDQNLNGQIQQLNASLQKEIKELQSGFSLQLQHLQDEINQKNNIDKK